MNQKLIKFLSLQNLTLPHLYLSLLPHNHYQCLRLCLVLKNSTRLSLTQRTKENQNIMENMVKNRQKKVVENTWEDLKNNFKTHLLVMSKSKNTLRRDIREESSIEIYGFQ